MGILLVNVVRMEIYTLIHMKIDLQRVWRRRFTLNIFQPLYSARPPFSLNSLLSIYFGTVIYSLLGADTGTV